MFEHKRTFTSPSRGEGGAPSLSPASSLFAPCCLHHKGLSDLGAPGGGVRVTNTSVLPTRNAIGLSPLVAFDLRLVLGGLSPWRSILPPRGGGKARGATAGDLEVIAC